MTPTEDGVDLLYGVPAIAEFMGLGTNKIYHLHKKGTIPTFRIDGKVCARKSTLVAWLATTEANARKLTEEVPDEHAAEDADTGAE